MSCVYQFKVVLRGISPMIWRRLLLRSDHSIADLHYTIQIAMGWTNSHLHRFHIHGKDYGVAHEGGLTFSDDPERVLLGQFGFRLRERFLYEYDFYDNWEHDIRLEKVLPLNSKRVFPVCIRGQRPVPPEDSGGPRAYREEGDPRWRTWWDAVTKEPFPLTTSILFKPLIDGAPVNSVRPTIAMSFDPIDGSYQTSAILDDGAVTLGIEETFDRLGYQSQVFPRDQLNFVP
jgi:Plasmid pRiA4b ORF-3-like protein